MVYAEVTEDTSLAYTTGEVKILAPVAEVSKTISQSQQTNYYDNVPMVVINGKGADTVTCTVAVLGLETLAEVTGQQFDSKTGALIEGPVTPTYFALGYRFRFADDGTYRYVWRLKGQFTIPDETASTENDGTDSTNQSLIYTGVSTIHQFTETETPANAVVVNEADGLADVTDWFEEVVTPDTVKASTNVIPVPSPPPVITDGTQTDGYPIINWTAVSGADTYSVFRALQGSTTFTQITSSLTSVTYTDVSAVAGEDYQYYVVAVNAGGSSDPSNTLNITAPLEVPDAPVITNGTLSSGYPIINWTAVSGATSYNVFRSPSGGGVWTEVASAITAVTFTDSTATPGTDYDYYVVAVNTAGPSDNSNVLIIPCPPAIPVAPTVTDGTQSTGYPILDWSAVTGAVTYNIYRAPSGTTPLTEIQTGVTGLTFEDTTAVSGTAYDYAVTAVNSAGESPESSPVTTITAP